MGDKLNKEIEEILSNMDDKSFINSGIGRSNMTSGNIVWKSLDYVQRLSPGKLFLVAVVLFIMAFVLRHASPDWTALLVWLGVVSLIGAYVWFLIRSRTSSTKPKWRGKEVDYKNQGRLSWWSRFKGKL